MKQLLKQTLPLLCLLAACTERVNIRTGEGTRQLAVYGYLTSDTTRHAVTISRSAGYFATTPPEGIPGATVTLSTDDATFRLAEDDRQPGTYLTAPGVFGVSGKSYTLDISLDFDGDGEPEEYRATSYMPLTSAIDSIALRLSPVFKNQVEVLGYGTLPDNEKNFLSFHLYRNGTLLTGSLEDFLVVDDSHFRQKEMTGVLCQLLNQEEEETTLADGDTVTLRVDILTEEYARFIQQAQQELRAANPIFGGPPANVVTNVQCISHPGLTRINGFFTAFPTHQKSAIWRAGEGAN
ncbi:MAG: DUF4249 domain-containing protein [Odoribacteraceae bacterium]|jgi:hypothetical protein|nr:DUF4249 domain-containing protein [Odoribacteraceae bacterium]